MRPSATRALAGALLAAVTLALVGTGPAVPTADAATRPAQVPANSIVVTSVSPWVDPDGDFRVELRVEGDLPADATITTEVHQRLRATSRTPLRTLLSEVIQGGDPGAPMQAPRTQPIAPLGDPSVGIVLDTPIRSGRSGGSDRLLLPNPGVHPVTVTVGDGQGGELASTTVFLNRLPVDMPTTEQGGPGRLSLSLYSPVDGPASLRPSGQPDLDDASRESLSALAELLTAVPTGPLTIAVRPNLLDALSRSEDPADRRTLELLQQAVADPARAISVARMPYAAIDTGGLVTAPDGGGELLRQIALGDATVQDVLRTEPSASTWYGDDTVTTPSLEILDALGVRRVASAANRLELTDDDLPDDAVSTLAVGLAPSRLTATAPDPALTALLDGATTSDGAATPDDTAPPDDTARPNDTARAESPAGPGQRANDVVTTLMTTWFTAAESSEDGSFPGPSAILALPPDADPDTVAALYAALGTEGPITTDPAAVPSTAAVVDGTEVTAQLPAGSGSDQAPAVRSVVETRSQIDGFRSLAPDAAEQADEWDRIDAQTLDRSMSSSERDTYHRRILADIELLTSRIELPKERRVVITSTDATIPLRFRNDLPYPVQLQLWVRSVRLDVTGGDRPVVTLQPGENRIDLAVTARAPGGTLLRIDASSPDGELVLPAVAIPVTASTISGVGAALSIVSLLFLAGWWTVSIRRDRRRRREVPPRTDDDDTSTDGPQVPDAGSDDGRVDGGEPAGVGPPGPGPADSVGPSG